MLDKAEAYRQVRRATRAGVLAAPEACSECGCKPGRAADGRRLIQGHHHRGYDRPLDLQWLCVPCHRAVTPKADFTREGMATSKGYWLGSRNPASKLDEQKVTEILRRLAAGALGKDLAEEYDVSTMVISAIRRGKIWVHVDRALISQAEGEGA